MPASLTTNRSDAEVSEDPKDPRKTSISIAIPVLLLTLALTLAAPAAAPAAAQSPPPDADWRTFSTEHFRVTYLPELEPLARQAGTVAERAHTILARELADPPAGMIDVLVTDHVDWSNGFATQFPSNRITLFARPATAMPQIAYVRDWMEMVVAHELVHIFHRNETGRVGAAVRAVFGTVPMMWPVFPVAGSPTWSVEGLATYYESRLTGAGRIPGSFHEMIIRTAALEDRLPDLGQVSAPHPAWPSGQRSYGYGSHFMDYIAEEYGVEAHSEIVAATGASILPTFLFFDHVARHAVGVPFDDLYDDWRARTIERANALAADHAEAGITETGTVAATRPFAVFPRVSPDGRHLSFASHGFRSYASTHLVDLETGSVRTVAERNQFGTLLDPATWMPDGQGMIVAQLEFRGPYRAYSDLWHLDLEGRERRITHGQRIAQPDISPDGRRVAAVRSRNGALDLVLLDLDTGDITTLAEAGPGDAFDHPRWSPDGTRLATTRYLDGRVDLVLVDVATGEVRPITDDDALDLAPAWSPDGRWLLWSSDRSGIPNIHAIDLAADSLSPYAAGAPDVAEGGQGGGAGDGTAPPERAVPGVRQVTRLLTGAFDPEISPDGRTLFLSVYHHDGWHIERLPFDPSSWRDAPEGSIEYRQGMLPPPDRALDSEVGGPSSSYSPWATVRPYFWQPDWSFVEIDAGGLHFPAITTWGHDLIERHDWELTAGVDIPTRRVRGRASWLYRGISPADLRATVSRDWRAATTLDLADGGEEAVYQRSDGLRLDALIWYPRWRHRAWLRVSGTLDRHDLEGHDMSRAELRDAGWILGEGRTLRGLSVGPGVVSAANYPISISAADGVSASIGLGRWWDVGDGTRAYDEVVSQLAGYLPIRLWGFADHVLAGRVAGLTRIGDAASPTVVGGVPGGTGPFPFVSPPFSGGAFFHVRGFRQGHRVGTRAWAASGEWRFPIHMRDAPDHTLGFSLTSVAGALFADAADAWCSGDQVDVGLDNCAVSPGTVLSSAGAEITVDFGMYHNRRRLVRIGVAQPITGTESGRPVFYLGFGPAF